MIFIIPIEEIGLQIAQRRGTGKKVEWSLVFDDSNVDPAIENLEKLLKRLKAIKEMTKEI